MLSLRRAFLIAPLLVLLTGGVAVAVVVPEGTSLKVKPRALNLPSDAANFPDSDISGKSLRWSGWGNKKAVGKGKIRACTADIGCTSESGRIVLSWRIRNACGDEPLRTMYMRATVKGVQVLGKKAKFEPLLRC